ncbi:MAG: UDP-glucose 4-epimerase GalE [Candidatus Nomurabacteria bacterium]|jgi:UDP-glucose 4-epimerase|nr:UDP-glucose 4-epimerase GalE [Candidatus Nomurabacteria bacterium]
MKILLTGGAGYIGSHVAVELYNAGHTAVIVDDLSNSKKGVISRISEIVGAKVPFYKVDLRNKDEFRKVFQKEKIDGVINFAGLKAVGESVAKPLEYYDDNLITLINLLELMREFNVKKFVFSSSAAVYGGNPDKLPYTEDSLVGLNITSPYGRTKYFSEEILRDYCAVDPDFQVIALRYFNPIGAHESGRIGEDPSGVPNNLVPYIAQVAVGRLDHVSVYGDDYDTPDGTCVRDYLHVVDLAIGHVMALGKLKSGIDFLNLGIGSGVSVLELIRMYEKAAGRTIPYEIAPRRAGDIDAIYASPAKAQKFLNWQAKRSIEQACVDSWYWQSQNPNGYGEG